MLNNQFPADPVLLDGFTLMTADTLGGIGDLHDRAGPASAEEARRWPDPALAPKKAEHLARTAMLDVDQFEWVS